MYHRSEGFPLRDIFSLRTLVGGGGWECSVAAATVATAAPINLKKARWVSIIWDATTIDQGLGPLSRGPSRRASIVALRAAPWSSTKYGKYIKTD